MRCITIRQPFAWAIFHGKNVENRTGWRYTYTGLLGIHAGLHLAGPDAWDTVPELATAQMPMFGAPRCPVDAELGAVIGVVDAGAPHWWHDCRQSDGTLCSPWAQEGAHHLPLRAPRMFRAPVPAVGRLGLWRPERDVSVAVKEVL